MLLMPVQFSFTSHLVLQACRQQANELAGAQHGAPPPPALEQGRHHVRSCSSGCGASAPGEGPSSLGPGEYLHQLLPILHVFFVVDRSVPPHSCFAGLGPIWRSHR